MVISDQNPGIVTANVLAKEKGLKTAANPRKQKQNVIGPLGLSWELERIRPNWVWVVEKWG